jgi:hypothetical protein
VLQELSALCDDYEQQLFEEECLLLPRLQRRHAAAEMEPDQEVR